MCFYISQKVGKKWKRFARNLEIDDEVIDQIDLSGDNKNFAQKCMAVLKESGEYEKLRWNQVKVVLIDIELGYVASLFEDVHIFAAGRRSNQRLDSL